MRVFSPVYVRFGSKADFAPCLDFVRFTPKSGHGSTNGNVRFVPKAAVSNCSNDALDNLASAGHRAVGLSRNDVSSGSARSPSSEGLRNVAGTLDE